MLIIWNLYVCPTSTLPVTSRFPVVPGVPGDGGEYTLAALNADQQVLQKVDDSAHRRS
jgi:hypothetical protein